MADYTFNLDTDSWSWKKGDYNGQSRVPYYFIEIYPPDNITVSSSDHVNVQIPTPLALPDNCIMHVQGAYTDYIAGISHTINEFVVPGIDNDLYNPQYNAISVGHATASGGQPSMDYVNGLIAFAGFVISNANGSKVFTYGYVNNYIYDSLGNASDLYLFTPTYPLDSHNYGTFIGLIEGPAKLGSWPYGLMLKSTGKNYFNLCIALTEKYSVFYNGTTIDVHDPNPGDGDSHGGGGGGTDDLGGDPIKDTGVPTIEATDSGLMTLYNPTVSELQALGRFLWSDGLDLNAFKKLFNDPFDTLLGLSIIPIVPPTSGTRKIMFGNLDSGVSAKVISHQFVPNVDMGSITLGEVYNGALDYSPFTTVSIYLPFIGYRELNVQDIMNSKIHLVYKFDVLTGGCIAELYVDHLKTGNKSKDNSKFKWESHSGLLASFEGQCAVNIPLASQDYTNTIKAMIGAVGMVGGAAASFATGNPALGVAALAVGSANSAMQASTPTVQRSGHLSSSNAIMANLTPFLTVTRPHQCKPSNYYKLRGVPSQIYVPKLSSLTTSKHDYYLQVAEIPDIKVAGATDTEIAEIKNLLKEGVVL